MMQHNPENYCFCELAPLYALDGIEQQLAEYPELAEELADYSGSRMEAIQSDLSPFRREALNLTPQR
ncbi:hypothetical protein [Nostoc sp. CHAB 5715]|uniref:hypothetical protein n=1 Tax=Nostoc sp. CHAB 5715 TaxID=2780400 RepID=UPI001E405E96|nr:hypothetical protein [Nostoc sp. CHAB 5715]MCC5619811.1 hypothetical protein [Nostoc sp. CHAB 5715]